jgi:hypothetical protein
MEYCPPKENETDAKVCLHYYENYKFHNIWMNLIVAVHCSEHYKNSRLIRFIDHFFYQFKRLPLDKR